MKSLLYITSAALAVEGVAAHYKFQQLTVGGTKYPLWKYIRRNTNPDWNQNGPVTDLASKDLRCNVGATVSNGTETLTMKAGDEFTFTADTAPYRPYEQVLYMTTCMLT
jgi:hypothetical protein